MENIPPNEISAEPQPSTSSSSNENTVPLMVTTNNNQSQSSSIANSLNLNIVNEFDAESEPSTSSSSFEYTPSNSINNRFNDAHASTTAQACSFESDSDSGNEHRYPIEIHPSGEGSKQVFCLLRTILNEHLDALIYERTLLNRQPLFDYEPQSLDTHHIGEMIEDHMS